MASISPRGRDRVYRTVVWAFSLACLSLTLTGCSDNGLVKVAGEVTVDGSPLDCGTISFYSESGGPTAGTVITAGKYSTNVSRGRKRVEILGYKTVRQTPVAGPGSPMIDIHEQILPQRYNTTTELACEVTASGTTQNFALKK